MLQRKQVTVFLMVISGIYLLAWFIQEQLFINWDVSYILNSARLLLAGGTYFNDFFAPNPPMILYLYLPPLLLAKLTSLDFMLSFRLYIFMLASLSLAWCYFLTKKIFATEVFPLPSFFVVVLAMVFLILPLQDFGQRDHILVLLTLPYLLLLICRLEAVKPSLSTSVFIGFLAGVAVAIKPQFLIMPLLVEGYYGFRQKSLGAWLRPEWLMMVAIVGAHVLSLLLFYPDYVYVVMPYVLRNYYYSISSSWQALLSNSVTLFCCFPFVFFLAQYKNKRYENVSMVLLVALGGFLLSYITQRTTFYYHILPACSLAIIEMAFLLSLFISRSRLVLADYVMMAVPALLLVLFLFFQAKNIWVLLVFAPNIFFAAVGLLFAALLYAAQTKKNLPKLLGSLSIILLLGFLSAYLALRTPGYATHQFGITLVVLIILCGLLASRDHQAVGTSIFIATLGVVFSAYPVYFAYSIYWRSINYKELVLNKLIVFMRQQPAHRSIYVFSLRGNYGSPLFIYTGSTLVQRFDCMWPVAGFVKQALQGKVLSPQQLQDKNLFLNLIADDLRRHKPDLIFVDRVDAKLVRWDPHFDYPTYFSQNEHFRAEWKAYHWMADLKMYPDGNLSVYQRRA